MEREVKKLLDSSFTTKIRFSKWFENVVMVKNGLIR